MHLLKLIGLTIAQLAKQAWSLPQALATTFRDRGRQAARDEIEAERLDRIRHPDKYRGR